MKSSLLGVTFEFFISNLFQDICCNQTEKFDLSNSFHANFKFMLEFFQISKTDKLKISLKIQWHYRLAIYAIKQ